MKSTSNTLLLAFPIVLLTLLYMVSMKLEINRMHKRLELLHINLLDVMEDNEELRLQLKEKKDKDAKEMSKSHQHQHEELRRELKGRAEEVLGSLSLLRQDADFLLDERTRLSDKVDRVKEAVREQRNSDVFYAFTAMMDATAKTHYIQNQVIGFPHKTLDYGDMFTPIGVFNCIQSGVFHFDVVLYTEGENSIFHLVSGMKNVATFSSILDGVGMAVASVSAVCSEGETVKVVCASDTCDLYAPDNADDGSWSMFSGAFLYAQRKRDEAWDWE